MFLELIGTIVAGLAMAGVAMLINRISGQRLPRWIVPVAAGAAMIGMTISNEYSWFPRTSAALPEGLNIAQTVENKSLFRPWTYVAPYIDRFVAVDAQSVRQNPKIAEQRMADLVFFGRWAPIQKMPVLIDCAGARRASLADGVSFDSQGGVSNADWIKVTPQDPVLKAVCEAT
jgi:hypothetical protein